MIKDLCKICNKAVRKTHHAIKCDKCNIWVHTQCNKINLQTYKYIQKTTYDWFCLKCFAEIVLFLTISNEEYFALKQGKKIKFNALATGQSDQTTELIDKINDVMDNPENETVTGKYYQVEELPPLMRDLDNSLSFFHLNISPMPFHFEGLYTLRTSKNLVFDILCISETRQAKLNKTSLISISLPGYNIEYKTTDSSNGGTLIYRKNDIKYMLRKDLQIYKKRKKNKHLLKLFNQAKTKISFLVVSTVIQ